MTVNHDIKKLTYKQRLFIEYYLKTRNATQSARLAGYSGNENTLASIGSENLTKPQIQVFIEQGFSSGLHEKLMQSNSALSNPQQLNLFPNWSYRFGYVYFLRADNDLTKIGLSRNIKKRIRSLNSALPYDLKVLGIIKTDDCVKLEASMHELFAPFRIRGEWFNISASQLSPIFDQYRKSLYTFEKNKLKPLS